MHPHISLRPLAPAGQATSTDSETTGQKLAIGAFFAVVILGSVWLASEGKKMDAENDRRMRRGLRPI